MTNLPIRRLVDAFATGRTRVLGFIQRVRASAPLRERLTATLVFTAIFAFAVASMDYLITGGPDWNPGGQAYAMEVPSMQRAALRPPPQHDLTLHDLTPAPLLVAAVDYSVATEVLLGGPSDWVEHEGLSEPKVQENGGVATVDASATVLTDREASKLKTAAFESASLS